MNRINIASGTTVVTYRKTVLGMDQKYRKPNMTVECDEGYFQSTSISLKEQLIGLNVKPGDKLTIVSTKTAKFTDYKVSKND